MGGPLGVKPETKPETTLEIRAAEALRVSDFKHAIELFKRLVKQDPRPEWRGALKASYVGRARMLAARGLFEEAETALTKAAADGGNPDPLLYVQCLLMRGQTRTAAEIAVSHVGRVAAPLAHELAELAAALWLAAPFPLAQDTTEADNAEAHRWTEHALAAQQALQAWTSGRPQSEIDAILSRIPLRSVFRAVRLMLKAVMTAADDPARARELLIGVAPRSPFASLRVAVEAALPPAAGGAPPPSGAQQAFVAEVKELPGSVTRSIAQWTSAERNGPAALLSFLMTQKGSLPEGDLRRACLDLLPSAPDRLRQFERAFGPLPQFHRHRVLALAAEASGDWKKVEAHWTAAARSVAAAGNADAQLSAGVIYRHLAGLARGHVEIAGDGIGATAEIRYLALSLKADPGHLPAVLQLIELYRTHRRDGDWHRLAAEAAERFPRDSTALLQAMDSAMARKAYKRAAGLGRRLLALDPINQMARQRLIEFHVSHARKHMRAKRTELARRELAAAAECEHVAGCLLHLNLGLVGRELGEAGADAQLRRGVELAGGGVAGWFRAALEHALMKGGEASATLVREQLVRAQAADAPTKEAILAIAAAVTGTDTREARTAALLVFRIHGWLVQGRALAWSTAEFHRVAEMLGGAGAFDLMGHYAKAALGRKPGNPDAAAFRFYQIVARAMGSPDRLSEREMNELFDIEDEAEDRGDFHMANRIARFLDGPGSDPPVAPRRPSGDGSAAAADDDGAASDLTSLALAAALHSISPEDVLDLLETRGPRHTTAAIVAATRKATKGIVPEPVLREVARGLVDRVIEAVVRPGKAGRRPP